MSRWPKPPPHQRVPVANAAGRIVALLRIGRAREQERGAFAIHHPRDAIRLRAVAAQQAMRTHEPQVARPRDRMARRGGQDVGVVVRLVRIARRRLRLIERRHQMLELALVEAGEREIEALAVQRMQLRCQQLLVPAGIERELVVGDHVGAALRLGQMIEHHDRHGIEPETARRLEATVPGDHRAVARDQHRIGPAEFDDAGGDLRHLLIRVRARVARIGGKPLERPELDPFRRKAQGHRCDWRAWKPTAPPSTSAEVRVASRWLPRWLPGARRSARAASGKPREVR